MAQGLAIATTLLMFIESAGVPWIPPLGSRALVEVPIEATSASSTLDRLAAECVRRDLAIVSREASRLTCASEPDDAAQLAYRTANPSPSGPLMGFVRFEVIAGDDGVRLQSLRFAEYVTRGSAHHLLSEEVTTIREILFSAGLSQR